MNAKLDEGRALQKASIEDRQAAPARLEGTCRRFFFARYGSTIKANSLFDSGVTHSIRMFCCVDQSSIPGLNLTFTKAFV